MKKIVLIILFLPLLAFGQYKVNGINQGEGFQLITGTRIEPFIQKLDGVILADGITLNDTSGNGYDGKLVNSNYPVSVQAIPVISTSPTTEGYSMRNFSCQFYIIPGAGGSYKCIINRTTGNSFAGFVSTILINPSNELYYYSANSVSNSGTKITTLTSGTSYYVKVAVNNSGGYVKWEVNGTPGHASFTNYTPLTSLSGDAFYLLTSPSNTFIYASAVYDLRLYSDTSYSTASHWWPMAEGVGLTLYDVTGGKNLIAAALTWGREAE